MRHAMHTTNASSRPAGGGLGAHHVAVDPWRVIQFLEHRREAKQPHSPLDDLDPKLIDLFTRLKQQLRTRN